MAKTKILSIILYVVFALFFSYVVVINNPPLLSLGQKAPIDESIRLLNFGNTTFKKLLNKPLIVNFWATWCAPCEKELTILNKLANKYKSQVNFLGIPIDSEMVDIKGKIEQNKINYYIGLVDQKTIKKWQAFTIPSTYLLDKNGQVIWSYLGVIDEEMLEKTLKTLLNI